MKIAIFSHCTVDEISQNNSVIETAGGPACYCGITAKNMKFEIDLFTKVGSDFSFRDDLEKKGIFLAQNCMTNTPTTRFLLKIFGVERDLYLKTKCDQIEFSKSQMEFRKSQI